MIIEIKSYGPLETNTILFGCEETKKAAIVDPALGSTSEILDKAKLLGLSITQILLTHSHWDHIADLFELNQKNPAIIYVHPLDALNVEHPGKDGLPMLFPVSGVKPSHLIQDGESIQVGKIQCKVIHSPGHSPGSVCYFLPEEHLLFSGDTLFAGSIGALHFSTGEPEKMWTSLKKLSQLPPNTRIIPGHGPETTLAKEDWISRAKEIFS